MWIRCSRKGAATRCLRRQSHNANVAPMKQFPAPGPLWRNLARLIVIIALVWGAMRLIGWAHGLMPQADAGGAGLSAMVIAGLLLAYAIMLALPYVPGIEVGLALMMIEGSWVAPAVYGATVLGLMLAFIGGRLVPYGALARLFRDLGLVRAADAIAQVAPLTEAERLALLQSGLPRWLAPVARWRYVVLAVLINLPGNIALGGGGGLLLFAGLSRVFAPVPLVLTLIVAISPVPLAIWFLGYGGMH